MDGTLKVIIINGYPKSGKDEFYKILSHHYKASIFSTVQTPKEVLKKYYNWDGETKSEHIRNALSDLKDWSTLYFNWPFREAVLAITQSLLDEDDFLVLMVREPDEIMKLVVHCKKYNITCVTVLVKRPGYNSGTNHADTEVEQFSYDYILMNDGTLSDYELSILELVDNINKRFV